MQPIQLLKNVLFLFCFLLVSALGLCQLTEQWVKQYNGPENNTDAAKALAVDASGNVYVTGFSQGIGTGFDYATVKYDAAGNELWSRRYNGPGNSNDFAASLAVDAAGNVYVSGQSTGSGTDADYATIKYDTEGNQLWVKRYNGSANGYDDPVSLAVDGSGNVYVTGQSYGGATNMDYATLKYDASGSEAWVRRYNSPENGYDFARSVAVDASGNVYVTGGAGVDYSTLKYDAAGNELWVKQYNGPGNGGDVALSLAVDASGNVYVTGSAVGLSLTSDYGTVKYDRDGNELWVKNYNGPGDGGDYAYSLAVDASGNVYITGASEGSGTYIDYATIKYDASGNELWVKRYNGAGNYETDAARALVIDRLGNVYVTGESFISGVYNDYATIKYDVAGTEVWVQRYDGSGNRNDYATALAADSSGNVYVTGQSTGSESGADYTTFKYSQVQTAVVSTFTLINADADNAIKELKDGDTINLETLATLNLNIRANTDPTSVGSVVFSLSGAALRTHTENTAPYALFANKGQDYNGRIPSGGDYTLTATPYSGSKGSGSAGTPLTIHFTVTGQVVSNLVLVNAETDQDIKTLQNGDVIDLSTLPTDKLNIRAVVHPDTVGSVVFNINNRLIVRENLVPYAIGGDIKGNYRYWTLPTGKHTLTATPYALSYGRGQKGKAHSVAFTVVDMAATTRAVNSQKVITDAIQNKGQSLRATPNPFAAQTVIRFSVPRSGYTTVQVFDVKGMRVAHLYEAHAEAGKTYNVSFDSKGVAAGLYMVKLVTGKHIQSCKLVVIR
jgi:hypothetical protein